jgi:CheY-like chemotaxis protein
MGKKILVVEDEWVVADDIQRILKDQGYCVPLLVFSGEEAIKKAEDMDLVLMDIVLEGEMDGIEAAEHIRSQYDIPVVFLTAYADEKMLNRARMVGPYGYIVKPFEDRELHATIEMALFRHEMEKKEKEDKQWLEEKIEERSRKIEILLDTRQNLQKEKNWENGLRIIAECMTRLGFERVGIFLTNSLQNKMEYRYGRGVELPERGTSISLNNTDYFGVRCVLEKETIYAEGYTQAEGKQITSESDSFVWVPIIVQNEAFAALAADNVKSQRAVTEENVKDLEILAGMCAAFIDRTRIQIEPVAEKVLQTEFAHWLDPREGYIIIEKKPEKSLRIFVDLVTHGIPGFVVSREHPEKLRNEYGLVKTPVLWLSRVGLENSINPGNFFKLVFAIQDFTKKCEESVILLEGLEYLISQISFETVLMYLQEIKDIMVTNNSRLIIPVHEEALSQKEYSMLEKEFNVVRE